MFIIIKFDEEETVCVICGKKSDCKCKKEKINGFTRNCNTWRI